MSAAPTLRSKEIPPTELGPYRLVRVLGRGGFAPVWLAREVHDERFLRDVAIKLFSLPPAVEPGSREAAEWRDGVLSEARALCRVEHPNVVRFHGVFRDDAAGLLGLVMELCRGASLSDKARERGALGVDEVIAAGADVAWALSAVHQAGLLHRDVKPANVIETAEGHRLIDFGIVIDAPHARAGGGAPVSDEPTHEGPSREGSSREEASREGLTRDGTASDGTASERPVRTPRASTPTIGDARTELVAPAGPAVPPLIGTQGYVAPELIEGAAPSPASDLFALGATMFRVATGLLPPPSLSLERIAQRIEAGAPGEAGKALGKLVARLLSPDPANRPRHAEWVARELRQIQKLRESRSAARGARDVLDGRDPRDGFDGRDPRDGRDAHDARPGAIADDDAPPSFGLGRARRADPIAPPPRRRPAWIGRAEARSALAEARDRASTSGVSAALVTGPFGIGRTRLLEEIVAGSPADRTLFVKPSPEGRRALWPLLAAIEALPEAASRAMDGVRDAIDRALSAGALPGSDAAQAVLDVEEALLCAAEDEPLAIAIDDAQWADAQLLSLLGALFARAKADHPSRLFVIAAVRDEPCAPPALRSFVATVRAARSDRVHVEALGPLPSSEAIALAGAVCALDPAIAEGVARASGGTPLLVVHALLAWHAASELIWEDGRYRADGDRVLRDPVPGMAEMLGARLTGLFEGDDAGQRLAWRVLACVAFVGGGLPIEALCAALPPAAETERVVELLADAGIVRTGDRGAISIAHEMARQAALNVARDRPWFWRLARAVLDEAARSRVPGSAASLADGYERLGAPAEARLFHHHAAIDAERAGSFAGAAAHEERVAALADDPVERVMARARAARLLYQARAFGEAAAAADAADAERSVLHERDRAPLALRMRALRMEIDAALGESVTRDPNLVAEADLTDDTALQCEMRLAAAATAPEAEAMRLLGEAVALAERSSPAHAFAARTQRVERGHAASVVDRAQIEEDLRRAGAITRSSRSDVQRLHIEGDLAILQADRGDLDGAIRRLRAVLEETTARRMSLLVRVGSQNLAALLHRAGRYSECADTARRAAEASGASFDPWFQSSALSLCADARWRAGDPASALPLADEAVRIQEARQMKILGITLLRRAEIKKALGRLPEARDDARRARTTAMLHGEADIELSVMLWEAIDRVETAGHVAALDAAIAEVARARAAGTNLRPIALQLLDTALARRRAAGLEPTGPVVDRTLPVAETTSPATGPVR